MKSTVTIDWTLVIAVYAALVSTVAVVWDFFKWKTAGPKLAATLATGMKVFGGPSRYGDDTLMTLTVTNRGDRPTTITHMTLHRYTSRWGALRRRAVENWFVPSPSDSQPLPFVLRPGAVWIGLAQQAPELEELAAGGLLFVGVLHSHAKRALLCRVTLRETEEEKSSG